MKYKNSKNMTIGLVLTSVPGYSETFFRNKIKGLQSEGIEVLLFVDSQRNTIDFPCSVIAAPDFGGNFFKTMTNGIITLFRILFSTPKRSLRLYQFDKADGVPFERRFKNMILNQIFLPYDLDWLHFGYGILAYRRENVAQAIGARMAASFRGFDLYLSPLKHPGCYNLLFKKDVRYHVLSEGMKQILKGHSILEDHITIITPAIDTDFFCTKNIATPKDEGVINIVTIARLHWIKGMEYTLEAMKILKQKKIPFRYTVIGDGDQYERLIFASHQLGLMDQINFVGKLSPMEVRIKLEESTIYLQYSIQEGFCNAVLEAQAMGLLCVVSDADGLRENVLDGQTGWVVEKRAPTLLAQKIESVLELPENEKQKIRDFAIARVKKHFNLEKQQQEFIQFYTES